MILSSTKVWVDCSSMTAKQSSCFPPSLVLMTTGSVFEYTWGPCGPPEAVVRRFLVENPFSLSGADLPSLWYAGSCISVMCLPPHLAHLASFLQNLTRCFSKQLKHLKFSWAHFFLSSRVFRRSAPQSAIPWLFSPGCIGHRAGTTFFSAVRFPSGLRDPHELSTGALVLPLLVPLDVKSVCILPSFWISVRSTLALPPPRVSDSENSGLAVYFMYFSRIS